MDRFYPLAESSRNVMITEPSHSSSTEPLPSLSDTLTFTPSSSSDAMCIPLTDDPSRSDSSNAMQTPVHGPSNPNDTLLTDCPSGSSAIMSTPKSENTRENTSNAHASTPISFTHSHGLKPMSLFNSPSTSTVSFQGPPAPETEKDITIMCNISESDISHLQQDEGDDTEQLVEPTYRALYKTKAAILISKVIKENHPAL